MLERVRLTDRTAAELLEPHLSVSIKKTLAIAWNYSLYLRCFALIELQGLLEGLPATETHFDSSLGTRKQKGSKDVILLPVE
jgi:hypothetical protein